MLADASISRADVSKAKPQRGSAGHRGTRTPVGGRIVGPASGDVGGTAYRLQEWSSAAEEEGRGGRGRRVGEMRVGEGGHRRGRARWLWETAMRVCRRGAACQRRASCWRRARRGEAVVTTTEEERRGGDLGENG
jgi:hypothetical protein